MVLPVPVSPTSSTGSSCFKHAESSPYNRRVLGIQTVLAAAASGGVGAAFAIASRNVVGSTLTRGKVFSSTSMTTWRSESLRNRSANRAYLSQISEGRSAAVGHRHVARGEESAPDIRELLVRAGRASRPSEEVARRDETMLTLRQRRAWSDPGVVEIASRCRDGVEVASEIASRLEDARRAPAALQLLHHTHHPRAERRGKRTPGVHDGRVD